MPDLPVFPVPWSDDADLFESYGYATDITTHETLTEQRRGLRRSPRESLEVPVAAIDPAEAQRLENFAHLHQGEPAAIPLWQYPMRTTADRLPGATDVPADTTFVPLRAAGLAVLYRSPGDLELVEIDSVDVDGITLADPIVGTWPAGSLLFPARTGRLQDVVALSRRGRAAATTVVQFTMDSLEQGTPEPPTLPQYGGIDVLELQPDRGQPTSDQIARKVYLHGGVTGARFADSPVSAPSFGRSFTWFCTTRAAVAELRGFIDGRRGRRLPFWAASWQDDLTLAADATAGVTTLSVADTGYLEVFAAGTSRRRLALRAADGSWSYRKVTDADDAGGGLLTLTLDSGIASDLPAGRALISFLRLCRLDVDEVRIGWASIRLARAEFQIRELPREVPA